MTYVVAAVRTAYPDGCSSLGRMLQALPLPGVDYLSEVLLSDLGDLPGNLLLTLDDYQQVQNLDVQQVVESLILQAPSNLHVVLLQRGWIRLCRCRGCASRSRLRRFVLPIFAFRWPEAGVFFERTLGMPLPPKLCRHWTNAPEGWIAGLRLAALSLQDGADPAALATAFRGTQHHVLDFLLEQVMAQQPPCVAEFLACTAPLEDAVCPSLQ